MAHFLELYLMDLDKKHKNLKPFCQKYMELYPDPYCILPNQATHLYTLYLVKKKRLEHELKPYYAQFSLKICALSHWRYTKSIYRFDETLLQELVMQKLDEIPIQILFKLKESAFFIEIEPTYDLIQKYLLRGFFVHYEYRDQKYYLMLTFLDYDGHMSYLEIPLKERQSVEQVIFQMLQSVSINVDILQHQLLELRLRKALNLVLYLCAENTDFSGRKAPTRPTHYKEPKAPHFYAIGTTAGQRIKDYASTEHSPLRAKTRPHMRSAHWHTYWVGKGRTECKINWIDPIFINNDEES